MIRHLRDVRARRRGEELVESGFTLIELLVVIVVLGILAATVVFALSGVTGQSAAAACNSDAKTVDVAVQAYINSPDNPSNTPPSTLNDLVSHTFTEPDGSTKTDTFMANLPNNSAYAINLYGASGATISGNPNSYAVVVATPKTGTNWALYDTTGTNPCTAA
ncbi:MAG TPA: prepilin-type N-terminal cleavage/methylation domain-containing protein [Acidimicrobiales bacterium]|nr:prepilin-type N-terminal cleavage/methylation domain-containing protein [Acidimicrobiales bacterium]